MEFQEASSSAFPCIYHVFLSFRGEDTRKTFTDHLHTALEQAGFHTFRDDDAIEKGEDIKCELEKAIWESRISIVIFSKNYASSTWCLEELVMILKRRTFGHVVLPIFYDVDKSEVRKQIGSFGEALTRHEEKLKFEMGELEKEKLKDKMGTWRAALREVADMDGMNLQSEADGYEARFIQKIIKVVGDKLRRGMPLNIGLHLVGMHSRVKNIQLWLEDMKSDVRIVTICGMGGIGKTTTARFLYDYNFSRFDGCSFIANVREASKQPNGLLLLQKQFLMDICKTKNFKLNNIAEGTALIKDIMCRKKILVVLDDVDKRDQFDALLGIENWLFPGSKVIITTRCERLLRAYKICKVHKLENLSEVESLELFSWHAFRKSFPNDGYEKVSERVVSYCGGLPLALKVLGSSLLGNNLNEWKSHLDKLKEIPNGEILEKLRISYESLQDDHDKSLFLRLACFFVGSGKSSTVTILDGCGFYTTIGIRNLMDRCLISFDGSNKLVIHHLLQEMGREIVLQESPKKPGERSILWNHEEAFNVLRESTGTSAVEGLKLNTCLLRKEAYVSTVFGHNQKRRYDEFIVVLAADAFAKMNKLKLLQLNQAHISEPYETFPKGLRWLCWHGFQSKFIPGDFPLESLVALDMQYSCLTNLWKRIKSLRLLKILNLSHSYNLAEIPKASEIPNLEKLVLESCTSLVKVDESIGSLERLVLLNLKDCTNLRSLPESICSLKHLEMLVISGCSNLDGLPTNMENMESLTVLRADGISLNQSPPTNRQVNLVRSFIWNWWLKPRESPEITMPSFPRFLVDLSLRNCNLSENEFPKGLKDLRSLKSLNLAGNLFSSLPDFIRGLDKLESLFLWQCPMLRKLDRVPQLENFVYIASGLVEEVSCLIQHRPTDTCHVGACNHPETLVVFKLESIENVEAEIVQNLGLLNLQYMENQTVKLVGLHSHILRMGFPLQVCYETHVIYTYIRGTNVPSSFDFKDFGFSIDFIMPSYNLNSRIQGLNVCSVYEHFDATTYDHMLHTVISNQTKGLVWSHSPWFFGIGEDGGDMMYLSYWKFGNHLEEGDKVNISVYGGDEDESVLQVKEVGVRLVYKEEPEEKSSQSAYEDDMPHQFCEFGNIVPGIVSAHQQGTKLYQLGGHFPLCELCNQLYPGISTSHQNGSYNTFKGTILMRGKPFYVSQEPFAR